MITPLFLLATARAIAYLLVYYLALSYHPILSNRCIQNDPVHTNATAFIAHFRYLNALETHRMIRIYIIILISIACTGSEIHIYIYIYI